MNPMNLRRKASLYDPYDLAQELDAMERSRWGGGFNAPQPEQEFNRHSRSYIRWIQRVLNQVLNAGLAVDGVMGRQTRSAIRRFQQQKGLTVDGIVGPRTEKVLAAASGTLPGIDEPSFAGTPTTTANTTALRQNIVNLVKREWLKWGRGSIKEEDPRVRSILADYWKFGVSSSFAQHGWWSEHPWSAAFISWIMKKSGAGAAFNYAAAHAAYISAAKQNRLADNTNPFKAYRISEKSPQIGDLICKRRAGSGATYENIRVGHKTHCDIVTEVKPGQVTSIGGNVSNSVKATVVPTDSGGHISDSRYFAVVTIQSPQQAQHTGATPGPSMDSAGTYGRLTIMSPTKTFNYRFTKEDALWTARFIVGEAGGRDNLENRAVIWAMFNRYAFFTHRVFPRFHLFIRRYSTTLQPVLRSRGAARRHMHRSEFVRTGGYYPNSDVPRGQLRRHLTLQKKSWHQLPQRARRLAENTLKGRIANPGVGNASEFANTAVYYRDRYGTRPTKEQWLQFTRNYSRIARKKWTWVGEIPGLKQYLHNTFFIDNRVLDIPANAVRVIPS
jgi:hypothetical protein